MPAQVSWLWQEAGQVRSGQELLLLLLLLVSNQPTAEGTLQTEPLILLFMLKECTRIGTD